MDEAHAGRGEGRHLVIVVGREDVKYEALKAEVMLGFGNLQDLGGAVEL
jgi:hypothetical protein